MSLRRVLVVGSDGFLGTHVLRRVEADTGLVGLPLVRRPRSGATPDRPVTAIDLVAASRVQAVAAVVALRPDVVVNCAGATTGSAEDLWRSNVVLVRRLIDAAAAAGAALVHIGSSAEYGPVAWGASVPESAPLQPVDAYGASKAKAAELVTEAAGRGRVAATVVRVFNPVGPGAPETTVAGRAVRLLWEAGRAGATVVELGALRSWRDFVDVRDVADAVVAVARHQPVGAPVLNVGLGRATCTRDLVQELAAVARFPGTVVELPPPPHRSAAIEWQQADITLAQRLLPWTPRRTVADALDALWRSVSASDGVSVTT